MRRRSPTNSRPSENLALRSEYRDANPACELSAVLGFGKLVDATDIHHIFGGRRGRADLLSNLMSLSREAHDWCERYKTDGRVLAVWVKLVKKHELRSEEFTQASGYVSVGGWLGTVSESRLMDATLSYYRELVSICSMGTD